MRWRPLALACLGIIEADACVCFATEPCFCGTGHAADSEAEERSSEAGQLVGEDSSGSSDDGAKETATALPQPLPEAEEEVHALEADAPSTSGREHAVGSPPALSPDLVTLALLPRSQWQGLVHLDAIKVRVRTHAAICLCSVGVQLPRSCMLRCCVRACPAMMRKLGVQERNKPIEPPKKPAQAPFFLPTVPGLARDPIFELQGGGEGGEGAIFERALLHQPINLYPCVQPSA